MTKVVFISSPQNKRMPLHWSASGGRTEIAEYLLGLGVPIDQYDDVSINRREVVRIRKQNFC